MRKLECIDTHQSCPNSQKAKMPLMDLAQTSRISPKRVESWETWYLRLTHPSEPISAQARSQLSPSKLG